MSDIFINALNAGQFSKKLKYRTDYDRRHKAVAKLHNANVMVQGGVERRSGTTLLSDDRVKYMDPTNVYHEVPSLSDDPIPSVFGASWGSVSLENDTGNVLLVPHNSPDVILYDTVGDDFNVVASHGEGFQAFAGGIRVGDKIILIPFDSDYIGIYDITLQTYTRGPAHGEGNNAFVGACFFQGKVIMAPYNSAYIGSYDVDTDTYTRASAHEQGINAFRGCVNVVDDVVMFAPHNSPNYGHYDGSAFFSLGPHDQGDYAFSSCILAGKKVVYIPFDSPNVTIYDFNLGEFRVTHNMGDVVGGVFGGGIVNGDKVYFTPFNGILIGVYDTVYDSLTYMDMEPTTSCLGDASIAGKITVYPPYFNGNLLKTTEPQPLVEDLETEHYLTVPMPLAGGTGSDHLIIYTDKTIMAYDVNNDALSDVTWIGDVVVVGDTFIKTPPIPTDHVVLNDVILFTTKDDVIHQLIRKFDDNGTAFFEFGIWDFEQPTVPLSSDGFTTQRVSLPNAWHPGTGWGSPEWVEGDYYYAYDYTHSFKYAIQTRYNVTNRLGTDENGANEMIIITNEKYTTHWVGEGESRHLELVTATDYPIGEDNRVFVTKSTITDHRQQAFEPYNDYDIIGGIVVIPTEADLDNTVEPDVADRYIAVLVRDAISVGDVALDVFDRSLPLNWTEESVDFYKINNPNHLKYTITRATPTVGEDGASIIQMDGTESELQPWVTVDDHPIEDITELPPFTNGSIGWIWSNPDIRVRDIDRNTNFTEDWNSSIVVSKTVSFGLVLGDWSFRTAGRWDGSYTLQQNINGVWSTFKIISSGDDHNVILSNEIETEYGVEYRVIIDLETDIGVQATRAGYTFTWSNMNAFYIEGADIEKVAHNAFSTWYSVEPNFAFESIVFHQQRLWLSYKSTIYASQINTLSQFALYGLSVDNSPISYRLADTQTSLVNWLHIVGKSIIIGTANGLWALVALNGVLTQSSMSAVRQTSYPTSNIKPINVGAEMLYVDTKQERIYATIYDYTSEVLDAVDITVYSEDMYYTKIKDISFDEINKLLHIIVGWNGKVENEQFPWENDIKYDQLVTMQYDKSQSVIAVNENSFAPFTDWEIDVYGQSSLDSIVQMGEKTYITRVPKYMSDNYNNNLRVLNVSKEVAGDFMLSSKDSRLIDSSDMLALYDGRECYYRSTLEKSWSRGIMTEELFYSYFDNNNGAVFNWFTDPVLPEKYRFDYYDDQSRGNYYKGIECMLPIDIEIETFQIDFGSMGPESTFGKKKNISEVKVLADHTSGGWVSFDGGVADKQYFADGEYGQQVDGYVPELKDGSFQTKVLSNSGEELILTLFDDSPYQTKINGFIYEFTQGG